MKIDYRDVVFSTLALLLNLGITLALLAPAAPLERLTGRLYPLALALVFLLAYGLVAATYLRLLTRLYPFREGSYSFGDPQFTLWKHCAMVGGLARAALSPLNLAMSRVLLYRLLGAEVGTHVVIGKTNITDPRLTCLDDLCTVGDGSILAAHAITLDRFMIRPLRVGRGATVGGGAVLLPGSDIGAGSVVAALSRVNPGTAVPLGALWDGIPAVRIRDLRPSVRPE